MRFVTDKVSVMGRPGRRAIDMRRTLRFSSAAEEYLPFEVVKVSDSSVVVHAGAAVRWVGGTGYYVPLTVDSGTSDDPLDVKTITGVSASGYITIELDSVTTPATLTAQYDADNVEGTAKQLPIAKITVTAGVLTVVQLKVGVWDEGATDDILVKVSSNDTTAGYLSAKLVAGDYLTAVIAPEGGDEVMTINLDNLDGVFTPAAHSYTLIIDAPWWVFDNSQVKHVGLDFADGVAGQAGQNPDHDARYWIKGSDYTENYGTSIGYDATHSIIALDSTPQLLLDWACTGSFEVTDEITSGSYVDAATYVDAGTYVVAGTYLQAGTQFQIGAGGTNVWSASALTLDVSAASTMTAASWKIASDTAGIEIEAATVVNLDPAGELQVNGLPGVTQAGWFTKGLFTSAAAPKLVANLAPGDTVMVIS